MADPRVQQRLEQYQIFRPEVDLSEPQRTSHAEYWYNLHIVVANDERYMEIRDDVLAGLHDMILRASNVKGYESRAPPSELGGGRAAAASAGSHLRCHDLLHAGSSRHGETGQLFLERC